MTDENRCVAIIVIGVVALVAVISIVLLLVQGRQSDAHMMFMAACVPDDVATKQVSSGDWVVLNSACCPQMHAFWSCSTDRNAYDLIVPINMLNHGTV